MNRQVSMGRCDIYAVSNVSRSRTGMLGNVLTGARKQLTLGWEAGLRR